MVWWGPFYAWTCIKKIDGYDYEPTTTKETDADDSLSQQ